MVTDPTQDDRDKYNRLLRYVYVDQTFYNEEMIKEGFAVEYTYKVSYQFQSEFRNVEQSAKSAAKGLWSTDTCGGDITKSTTSRNDTVINSGLSTKTNFPAPSAIPPDPNCPIKGNISSGGKIYHVPDGIYYDKTVIDESAGERWFCNEAEAVAAGWRKSSR